MHIGSGWKQLVDSNVTSHKPTGVVLGDGMDT